MSGRRGGKRNSSASAPAVEKIDVRPFFHPKPTLNPFLIMILDIVGIPLVPIRALLMLISFLIYWVFVRFATFGLSESDLAKPLPSWRRSIIKGVGMLLGRLGLFISGFYWIKQFGTPDPRAKTIVSNHTTFLDVLYFMSALVPSFVAKEGTKKVPFVGYFSQTWNSIFAPSALEHERDGARSELAQSTTSLISERQKSSENFPPLIVFPEGTTTNGQYLISFKTGAFVAGEPVQPVVLRYPFSFFAPSWETILLRSYLWKLWSGLYYPLEAHWLPLYIPSEQEKADPRLYASNVRAYMAKQTGVPLSDSTVSSKAAYHRAIMAGEVSINKEIDYL